MLKFENLTISRGNKYLLENINWFIKPKQRIGLIGNNGCGKSSLFALLRGEIEAQTGHVDKKSISDIAYLAQEIHVSNQIAIDFVIDGDEQFRKLEKKLQTAQDKGDGQAIAKLHEQLQIIDAYSIKARAANILNGLGFSHQDQKKALNDFSGGWLMRLNLAKTLISRADLLLLDEPTNHLDLEALLWLENFLKKYPSTLILISHDRDFLDKVVNVIAHIEHKTIKLYTGNYSEFEKLRAEKLLLQQAQFDKQQKIRAHMQSFVDRFRAKATKAKQAQSRVKALEKMQLVSAVQLDAPFQFEFKEPLKKPSPLLTLDNVKLSYGEKIILNKVNFSLQPGDRISIIGPNGAGKSTLIKCLARLLKPTSGEVHINQHTKFGYFAQHQLDHLIIQDSPLQHLQSIATHASEQQLRNFLGGFGFKDDMATTAIASFSGGEKARLALALIVWQQPNILLLDEPTNHFDLTMRQALSLALQEYEGALILISHDRHLIRTTTDELYLVYQQGLQRFSGSIDDYPTWLREHNLSSESSKPESSSNKKQNRIDAAQIRKQQKPLREKIKKIEKELKSLEQKLEKLNLLLQDQTLYDANNKDKLQTLLKDQGLLKQQLQTIEDEWLLAQDQLSS